MAKPIHTYLDLDVVNNNLTSDTVAPALRLEETRNTPFLDGDSSEYFLSITRFSIQTGNSLPIFIPRIETGQGDRNKTVYSVTLMLYTFTADANTGNSISSKTYEETATVMHSTSDLTADLPQPPLVQQDLTGTYYYQYNASDIVAMFNAALYAAWLALRNDVFLDSPLDVYPAYVKTMPPVFEFDSDQYRLILNVNQSFCASSGTTSKLKGSIYFNTRFYELLSGLACDRVSRSGVKNYQFTPDTTSSRTVKDSSGVSHSLYSNVQEISSLAVWNPIASVVFCSGMLPIVATNTSPPLTYDDTSNNNLANNGNNSNLTSIISDFEIPVSETNKYRPVIVYNPSAEYRLIDMYSSSNLNKIDIMVFWKTHYGEYIPLRLQPGCAAHIKLMFRHETFYLGY